MKLLGTIDEWIKHKPDAYLTNRKYLQKGVSIHSFSKHSKPEHWTYPIGHRPDDYQDTKNYHTNPLIYFGAQCPYIVSGYFNYDCGVIYWPSGCGGFFPLSDEMVNDNNWEEFNLKELGN